MFLLILEKFINSVNPELWLEINQSVCTLLKISTRTCMVHILSNICVSYWDKKATDGQVSELLEIYSLQQTRRAEGIVNNSHLCAKLTQQFKFENLIFSSKFWIQLKTFSKFSWQLKFMKTILGFIFNFCKCIDTELPFIAE